MNVAQSYVQLGLPYIVTVWISKEGKGKLLPAEAMKSVKLFTIEISVDPKALLPLF